MKNTFETRENITAIFLRRRDGSILECLIDTADLARMQEISGRWTAMRGCKYQRSYYVASFARKVQGGFATIYAHRHLVAADSLEIDHEDGDGLNNRRRNLVPKSRFLNSMNRGSRRGSASHIRGVSWDKSRGKWYAALKLKKRQVFLGRFDDPRAAGSAVDQYLRQHNLIPEAA